MNDFQEFQILLQECVDNTGDPEVAHTDADNILCDVALNVQLTIEERIILVEMWQQVRKWYA